MNESLVERSDVLKTFYIISKHKCCEEDGGKKSVIRLW